ncbi:MAG: hypothetical protein ACRC68_07180, partial [Clostridium sp.]
MNLKKNTFFHALLVGLTLIVITNFISSIIGRTSVFVPIHILVFSLYSILSRNIFFSISVKKFKKISVLSVLVSLIIITFNSIYYILFNNLTTITSINIHDLILVSIALLIGALDEELFYRFFLINLLNIKSSILIKILFSST